MLLISLYQLVAYNITGHSSKQQLHSIPAGDAAPWAPIIPLAFPIISPLSLYNPLSSHEHAPPISVSDTGLDPPTCCSKCNVLIFFFLSVFVTGSQFHSSSLSLFYTMKIEAAFLNHRGRYGAWLIVVSTNCDIKSECTRNTNNCDFQNQWSTAIEF